MSYCSLIVGWLLATLCHSSGLCSYLWSVALNTAEMFSWRDVRRVLGAAFSVVLAAAFLLLVGVWLQAPRSTGPLVQPQLPASEPSPTNMTVPFGERMQLYIKLADRTLTFEGTSNSSVGEVVDYICEQSAYHAKHASAWAVFRGQGGALTDRTELLGSCGLGHGHTVDVLPRMRGGGKTRGPSKPSGKSRVGHACKPSSRTVWRQGRLGSQLRCLARGLLPPGRVVT